jgi:hypothetical protein
VFDGVPDIRAELLHSAEAGDTRWAEWQHDRIMWGRLYMEDVDRSGGNIDQAVRRMTTTTD